MASGFWTGAERATGNLAQTGMQLLNYQAGERQRDTANAMLERRVNLAEEQGARESVRFGIEQAEHDKKLKQYNQPLDITTHPMYLAMAPESQKWAMEYLSDPNVGIVSTKGIGKTGDILNALKTIESSKDLFEPFMAPTVNMKKGKALEAWNAYQDALANGDEKKTKIAGAEYNKANAAYQTSMGNFEGKMAEFGESETPMRYIPAGGDIYGVKDGKSTLIQAGTPEPSVARQEHDEEQEKSDLYDSLYELGHLEIDGDNKMVTREEYTPEEYKALEEDAKKLGYKPVARSETKHRWGENSRYKVAGFRKIKVKSYGSSTYPDGTEAVNTEGITIITKGGKWIAK